MSPPTSPVLLAQRAMHLSNIDAELRRLAAQHRAFLAGRETPGDPFARMDQIDALLDERHKLTTREH